MISFLPHRMFSEKGFYLLKVFTFILFFLCFSTNCYAQKDSSFYDLKLNFTNAPQKSEEAYKVATSFLKKAKNENDVSKIVEGYELFINYHSHTPKAISYADSIILLTKNVKLNTYPAKGYLLKGTQLYYNSQYNEALNNFAIANDMALTEKNISQQIAIKHYIGLLKNVSDEREEALKIFQENINFIIQNGVQKKDSEQYLKSLFALADSYNKNKILDSAEVVHQRGIIASLQDANKYLYPWFLTSYGVTSYYKENYTKGIDSLQKAATFFKHNEKALCSTYLYIYRCMQQQKDTNAISYLYKIDSIYKIHPKVIFQAREAFEFLNAEHKAAENSELQLEAIEKLLSVDEIITKDYQNLSSQIVKKYETPLLLSEKEELISKLESKNFLSRKTITILIIFSILLIMVIFYFVRRNIVYKKRFDALMKEYETKSKKETIVKKLPDSSKDKIGLPQDIVDAVLVKLEKFERSHKFTKKSYTLTKLAKELDTNSTYLSKIINITKNMNFANYMNEVRIDYAITQLKENKLFRSYTIKAIAQEVGFNNAQSFSIAFHKKTGIHPSYFLKQLENQDIRLTA